MHKTIACILTIIYLSFTAGAVWNVQPESSGIVSIETFSGDNTDAPDKEPGSASSHIKIVNFHKAHKHLAASHTCELQRLSFANLSSAIHTSSINAAYKKVAAITSMPALFQAPIFIKNCVLRV